MSQGFIKLNRAGGLELLEEDPKVFLLLSQIAMRARRIDAVYSRVSLKANQAFLGDHEKTGLTREEYRSAKKRLAEYGLATFQPTNKGTIATLISSAVYDINAEPTSPSAQPSKPSMRNQEKEPSGNQPATFSDPTTIKQRSTEEPLTRKEEAEECKKATTPLDAEEAAFYESLRNSPLSSEEKASLNKYPEERVLKALEWASKAKIKTTLIQALHWHCKEVTPPLPAEMPSAEQQSETQIAAWEYNLFLQNNRLMALATKNKEAIPQHFAHIIADGRETSITLKNPINIVKADFAKSINEVLATKGMHHG